jgi:hypothetical protein
LNVFCSFANDFNGHEDVYWTSAHGLFSDVFPRFGSQTDGMNPLQQRVAIKFMHKVKQNMEGYYPALTRDLVSLIGPYRDAVTENPRSAFSLLREAFYAELRRFPEVYQSAPEKAGHYLPKDVRYDAENASLVKIYRLGRERSTELRTLTIGPVSFAAEAIRNKPDP